jgi:hypothetical protein
MVTKIGVSLESGVPTNKIFEHLEATIAEATPLYELCENVLNASSEVDIR